MGRLIWHANRAKEVGQLGPRVRAPRGPAPGEGTLRDAARCARAQFKVPIIQGCLKYAHQASSTDLTKDEKVAKIKAEAWAFCVGALAFLNEADSEAAQAVEK